MHLWLKLWTSVIVYLISCEVGMCLCLFPKEIWGCMQSFCRMQRRQFKLVGRMPKIKMNEMSFFLNHILSKMLPLHAAERL